jgi:thiol-disulfide isomerase/thioredoxin
MLKGVEMKKFGWMIFTAVFTAAILQSSAATLKVGDPAPKLQVGKWIQGEPVAAFSKDKAYIVEFWATWCGPCKESIPHLNEIANKYKDRGLVVIGQSIWEEDDKDVPKFVRQMGSKMSYRVAVDDKKEIEKGAMANIWMEAAGQNGIPTAFLVDKNGKIAYIGGPLSLKEETIEQVLAGKFDLKKAAQEYELKRATEEKLSSLQDNLAKVMEAKDWAKAEMLLNEIEPLMDEADREDLDMDRLKLNLNKGDSAGSIKFANKLAARNPEHAGHHDGLAWMILTIGQPSRELLEIANKEANRAVEISKGEDPSIMDTLARAQFMRGEKEAAVKTQEKAIALQKEEGRKEAFKKTLDSYKAGKLPD